MNNEPNIEIRQELINIFKLKQYSKLLEKISKLQINFNKSIFLLDLTGVVNSNLQNYEEAIKNFKSIIKINPLFADAYYNLGNIYKTLNLIDDSIKNYLKCIEIEPNKFEAHNNLGNIFRENNNIGLAIEKYLQCLEINPNYLIALQNFGICLQNFKFNKTSSKIDRHIINLLNQNNILRPVDIINSLINYIHLDPKFKLIIKKLKKNYLLENLIEDIYDIKILIALMKITPIADLNIEKIIRYLRSNILLNISSIKNREITFKVMESIASQCFINEYIYPLETTEKETLKIVEQKIIKNLKEKNLKNIELEIACLSSYQSLNLYNWSDKIVDSKDLSELVKNQINEPNREIFIKKEILSKKIKNSVSLKVKNQYESNPYPRWNKIALSNKPQNLLNYFNNLNLNIEKKEIEKWKNLKVLVAGCGTGQHAIATASKYQNSYITAIDLSLASLSYAKRKADELGINNIDFIQMDILDLQNYEKKFDIIESVGVLHHMDDPYDGLKSLYQALNLNGLIMIGLYSKIARAHIERIRLEIKKLKIETNKKNIKKFRENIISSNTNDHKLITESSDFYSLSSVRDLLFHIQEHRFTIPQINNYLNKLNLKFCGFENRELLKFFIEKNSKINDLYNLDLWNEFEINNPRIFAGMYQFWCQKI